MVNGVPPRQVRGYFCKRKKHPTLHPYYIHGHQLKYVDHVKYLGVNITNDLRWGKHVDIICNKANSALGFVRHNVNIGNAKVHINSCI